MTESRRCRLRRWWFFHYINTWIAVSTSKWCPCKLSDRKDGGGSSGCSEAEDLQAWLMLHMSSSLAFLSMPKLAWILCYNLLFRTKSHYLSSFSTIGPDHFHGLSVMRLPLFISFTQSTGDYRKRSLDFESPDRPKSLSGDPSGLSGASYHDPLQWHHEF
jgi:hypothetical protein